MIAKLLLLPYQMSPPRDFAMSQLLASAAEMEPEILEGHKGKGAQVVAACIRTASIIGGPRMLNIILVIQTFKAKSLSLKWHVPGTSSMKTAIAKM